MISKLKLFEKHLNLLLIFLIPTQLALHFWPEFAFVFGIRVDYLSPTIYLTDVLSVSLLVPWLLKSRSKVLTDIKRNRNFLVLFLVVLILNLSFSTSFWVSFIKWIKIIELVILGYYIRKREDVFTVNNIGRVLFYSLFFFSAVGVLQFLGGKTLGGPLYLVGERTFSIFTPGIALVNLLGKNFLRVYSTFPHPNSFAGFLGVIFLFFISNHFKGNRVLRIFGYLLMLSVFVLTFSLSAYTALLVCVVFYIAFKKHIFNKKVFGFLLIFVFVSSFYFSIFSKPLLESKISLTQSSRERLELGNVSGKIFSENWITGMGLNTFIINSVYYGISENSVWLLQPVHNIYLLIFTEMGILGIGLFCHLIYKLLANNIKTKNTWVVLIIVFVLVTGLFDHYWFTIQQNMLLLSLFFGVSFREKI